MAANAPRNLVTNRRAKHDYALGEVFEAGLVLQGSEVKSLRAGKANLQEAYVRLDREGATLCGMHISPYAEANRFNHEALRERRLLLSKPELRKLRKETAEKGRTVIPTRVYLKGSWVKVEIAVATGKKLHDKRHSLKEKQAERDMKRHKR